MKNIKEHIKSGNFSSLYLLYGSEAYLKKLYRDKLKGAVLPPGDTMNYSYFEGKTIDGKKVAEIAQTLPFLSEKRLILIENSGFFKTQSELSEWIPTIPDSTVMVFVETEVDKRNKLYKLVQKLGTVSEMNGLDDKNLKLFIVSMLEQEGKRITGSTVTYLLDRIGADMENIRTEVSKLLAYALDRDIITTEDIDAVVTVQITGKIFAMIDAVAAKQQNQALRLYYDLLHLREKPMSILYLLTRHINILLQVKDLHGLGINPSVISSKVGVPPFAVNKYVNQSRNFSLKQLKDALTLCAEAEEEVKTGRLAEKIAIELLIVNFSAKTYG